jgi:hypothetical protein
MSVDRRLRGLATHRQPDALFRRRLRSEMLNRWVAKREGLAPVAERRWIGREMGRLGRACLYASFALGVSAAGVLAVTQDAVPGEALYPLKLRIEDLRVAVLPRHLQDDLALNVLAERVDEVRRLASAGSVSEALALAVAIEPAYADVQARLATAGPADAAMVERRLTVIARLVEGLPPDLRNVLATLMPDLAIAVEPAATPHQTGPAPEPPAEAAPVAPAAPPQPGAAAPTDTSDSGAGQDAEEGDEGEDEDDEGEPDRDDRDDD